MAPMKWTEGHIHLAMRRVLSDLGWVLVAGEYPGGSDHELYPLNVIDPAVARDASPDPRRHSQGEMIPDLVALLGRHLFLGEAKPLYNRADQEKLQKLLFERRRHLVLALEKFAKERDFAALLPVSTLIFHPTLVFQAGIPAPKPVTGFSYLRIVSPTNAFFEGNLAEI